MATAKQDVDSTTSKKPGNAKTTGRLVTVTNGSSKRKAEAESLTTKSKVKQSSPIRLNEPFYKRMNAAAKLNSRSVPKHLEHMVSIAESVTNQVTREELLDIQSGLSKIVVEKIKTPRIDKLALFNSLENMRKSGTLSQAVTKAATKYQACPSHPGYLERINEDGSKDIGTFKGGKFKIAKEFA